MAWKIGWDTSAGWGWDVGRACCIEARDIVVVYLGGGNVCDVGAGVESLVLGPIEVGYVLELQGCVCAWGGPSRRIRDGDAAVSRVDFGDGELTEGVEVGLGSGIW